jgi:hypothetical protein
LSKVTFKDVVVDAYIGTLKLSINEINRERAYVRPRSRGPGMPGEYIQPMGRQSLVDTVSALMTLADLTKLETIADKPQPQTWIHPLRKGFEGYVESISSPISSAMDGYISVSFQVVEHYDPNTTILPNITITAGGAKAKSGALWDTLGTAVGDLPDWDGTGVDLLDAASFDDAWDSLGDGWTALESVYEDFENMDATVRDLSRSLNAFDDLADTFVDAAHDVANFIGETAEAVQRIPSQIVETGRDLIDSVADTAESVVSFTVTNATDLPSILQDSFGTIENMTEVMEANGIIDPFMLLPGTQLNIQRPTVATE